jgi:1-pyrroline-5-carboxylate dehydrogenase
MDGFFHTRVPENEPVRSYAHGSAERKSVEAEIARQAKEVIEIPCVVGGQEIRTGRTVDVAMPCDHGHVLAKAHLATPEVLVRAAEVATKAQRMWAATPWAERASVFLKAADLLAGPWRDRINVSTMLGQGKTVHQAEIDSACEIIDFWRYNVSYAERIYENQPGSSAQTWNRMDHRALDSWVLAITPFNFTSIAYNLPTAPAIMGNATLWKPATTQLLSAWWGYQLLLAAGLPPEVIAFIPSSGKEVGQHLLTHSALGGIHFTGGTDTFQEIWSTIGKNIQRYKQYPRIVGETGGKDFILAHESADVEALAVAIIRGSFEYQGQKCSAASRLYIPDTLWPALKDRLVAEVAQIKMGDVRDFKNFMGAVIDKRAFDKHTEYLRLAHETAHVITGGESDGRKGWYVAPTIVQVDDPKHRMMSEEIFGPIVTAYVYDAKKWDDVLPLVDETSPYALTGAVFARDRAVVDQASTALRYAAGNFYVNDKPTGAVVNQQPFGGGRASGTNDKAGSVLNLLRWVSPRTIKENFVPPTDWRYPFLG